MAGSSSAALLGSWTGTRLRSRAVPGLAQLLIQVDVKVTRRVKAEAGESKLVQFPGLGVVTHLAQDSGQGGDRTKRVGVIRAMLGEAVPVQLTSQLVGVAGK